MKAMMHNYLKSRSKVILVLAFVLGTISGCTSSGFDKVDIVEISPNLYMLGRMGGFMEFSGTKVKAELYAEARGFCSKRNLVMSPVSDNAEDSGYAKYASAEIQFRCLPN
tara:strand:+ start:181 stop:510 length:330 start_codon:yes stop_codon:yes gene_type:complete